MRFIESAATALALAVLAGCAGRPLPPESGRPAPSAIGAPPAFSQEARDWDEYRMRAARRILQGSGGETFSGPLPETLRAIPVLLVRLNADGSVRGIDVTRHPRFAPEALPLAINAIRRAAPFGPVGNLPRPWQFSETFLYNDDLKFQLRTLVEAR